jgi:hypothetical protein
MDLTDIRFIEDARAWKKMTEEEKIAYMEQFMPSKYKIKNKREPELLRERIRKLLGGFDENSFFKKVLSKEYIRKEKESKRELICHWKLEVKAKRMSRRDYNRNMREMLRNEKKTQLWLLKDRRR